MQAIQRFSFIIFIIINIFISSCSSVQGFINSNTNNNDNKISKIKFAVAGDIMVHSTQLEKAYNKQCNCWDFNPSFAKVKKYINNADIGIANLETTLPEDPKNFSGYPQFGTPDSILDSLKNAGFSILTTSNNHCLDKGKETLKRTILEINKRGMQSTGTFISLEDKINKRFITLEKNGIKIAFLSYTYSTNGIPIPKGVIVNLINREEIANDIQFAKNSKVDSIIVYYHFGKEYERFPDKSQRDLVEFTFNEGVDVVLGGHPHVLQPYELKTIKDKYGITKKRLVIFSLGNFISCQSWRYSNGGIIFYYSITKKNKETIVGEIEFEPVYVHRDINPKKYEFHLLPVRDYLDSTDFSYLNHNSKKQMVEFYNDTVEHLHKNSHVEE